MVCGSTQGIGKATAILLATEGANITLVARNETKLKNVLQELPNTNQNHNYIVADFSNPELLQSKLKELPVAYHILINNTGGPAGGPVFDATLSAFESAILSLLSQTDE